VTPNHPVFLTQTCGHVGVGNTLALELGGINRGTPDPKQGIIDRDSDDEPTGVLKNRAQRLVKRYIPSPSHEILKEALFLALRKLASNGITTIHDAWTGPSIIRVYQELQAEGRLPLRVGLMPPIANPFEGDYLQQLTTLGIRTGFGNHKIRVIGVKVALDGMIRSGTAALREPYEGRPLDKGLITIDEEALREKVKTCNSAGLRVCIHAEGDRGIDKALDTIEWALEDHPNENHRHRIEHFGLSTPDQMDRIRNMGVIPSVSINFIYDIGEGYKKNLGVERSEWIYPLKSLFEHGIPASCNSDWPVSVGNPLLGIYSAITRKTWTGETLGNSQRISLEDAIKAYTLNGAYASFEEEVKGSIEEGKLADMVVLDRDILKIPDEEILQTNVDLTMVGGKIVYQR
jgi:predicted amidohydrolase YtcJ